MKLFRKNDGMEKVSVDALDKINEQLKEANRQLKVIEGKKAGTLEETKLNEEIIRLTKEKVNKEIELDKVKETHARERRETEHMIGLERKRQEFEIESAKRDVTLTVREENLKAQQERFEENMQFMRERMEGELTRLNGLTSEILERLPVVKVDRHIKETVGAVANGNGKHKDDEDDDKS
jgi:hypothetical protein